MSTSSYFLRQQQEKKTSPSSISVGSNALNSSPQETRNMTLSTKNNNNNNNQSNMSAYSPLQRSSVDSIHNQDAEKSKNSYSPPARPSLNSRNNNGKTNRAPKKELSPLPIFNDKETHDIVVVAAGDRGLSGSHNKVLDKHVKRFNHHDNNDPEHRDPLYMQGHETLASEKNSDDEFRFQMEFYCHRNVLSAGSYFFRSFFAARSEARQNSNSPSHSRNHFVNENDGNRGDDDDDDECRRLVVHNVLPASLAHVIQSIYAAYANGTPEDPPLYDPIALSTAPISVIICAWELAMKLELRQVASNIVHILIPMISDENSLEVLKATTKYEHEQSVILQRACLHAKALPPKFRSRDKKELEEDKKLWQELCSQIPWLASTVVHLQDCVAGASNKKNQNRNKDHGVDNENETMEVSPQSTITANLSPHQRAEIKRKQHELDLALMKNNRGRQQNQIRKEKEDENDDEFEEDLQQLTKRALEKYSDAINVASSNPKNNSCHHDQQRDTQRNKRLDSSDDDDDDATQDGIMRNSRNNIEDDASSIGEATQQAWDDTASTVLGDDEDESEYRQNNKGKSKNKLTNMLNQHRDQHEQIMNRHEQILLQREKNNNNVGEMTYQQQQQQPPIPIDQHVSLVMDRTIQDDDDDDYDTSDENNHNRSIQKIENVYDAKDVMRLIGDDDDDDDQEDYDDDDDDVREDEQDVSRSNSKNDHEQHPLFSRLTPAVLSSVEALCVNNDRNEVATLVKNRQQQHPPASTTSISLLHSKATTTHSTPNTGFIPSSSTKAANDDRMKMYDHHHHQNQNQNSYSKNNNNNTVSVLRETMARTSQMKIVKPVAFTPNNNNVSTTTTTTKTTKSSITPPNNGNGRSPCRGTTETSDVPFNSNININNNPSTSTPTSQRFADHSSPPNKNSNNKKQEQTHRFANQHGNNATSSGIEKEIPDFEQKFLHSPSLLPQNNNNNTQNQEEQEEEEEEVAAVVEMPIYGNATQQQQRQPPLVFDPQTLLDPFTAQHKLKIIDQEIQQTYDNYASEMQNYRIIYENLRRETTDLWGMTGFVDNGNVPSSIGIAEKILENFSRKFVEERHEREELSKAIQKIESHLAENNTFDETSDAFLRGAQLAARELEYIRNNLGQMVGDYLHFSPEKKKDMKNGNNIDQNNEVKETVDEDDSQAASARLDAKQRSKRNASLMKIRSLIEDQLDETVRRLIDEGREVEATMRVREITVEQLKEDLAHEIKKFEMAKSKIEKRTEKMK